VWRHGRGSIVADPFRSPTSILATARAPVGSLADKLRIARLRARLRSPHPAQLLRGDDVSTSAALRADGFSEEILQRFFTPLVGGIQLDPDLADSRRIFDIIFRMLADGDSAVPSGGMQAIPDQLAAQLSPDVVRLEHRVIATTDSTVTVDDGDEHDASCVVIATEGPAAAALVDLPPVFSKGAGCVYFASEEPPVADKLVVLDGTGRGPVLNAAVMSNVAPTYAPPGRHLVVAALPGHTEGPIEKAARAQLASWWGPAVATCEHLATYRISHGQPTQRPPFAPTRPVRVGARFVCGDHRDTASIQGALFSGRRCAGAVFEAIGADTTIAPRR
jgi:phytoene dehydrogenase-like protein